MFPRLSDSMIDLQHGIVEPMATASLLAAPIPSLTMRSVQKVGENIFAGMIFVALAQALVALIQYRTNPSGQLIVPPGLTVGVASPADVSKIMKSPIKGGELQYNSSFGDEKNKSTISTDTSRRSRFIQRFNRLLFLLIPWASRRVAYFWGRNTHVFHLAFILTLNRFFDIPNKWLSKEEEIEIPSATSNETNKSLENVIIIGDSLAIGLGSVEIFDSEKDNSVPYMKIENIIDGVGPGPVFPKALAESIASHSRRQIHWRSAGVDGGDIQLINDFCFQVIEEEVANGRAPDVVVILCGANDLKYYVGNPLNGAGPKAFRSRLKGLIRKIKFVAPNCTIVLPSFPTQMFHRHSLLNIFPLNFFLDTVIGFWDSQKKLVADALPSEIIYFEMNPSEIFDWHTFEDGKDHNASTLISVDGVHPNAKCYGLWANSLGKKIVETVNHPTATRCKKGISGV